MNCKVCSNTTTNTPGIPFFRFPREIKKCQRWAELCHLKNAYLKNGTIRFNKSFRICSEHFDADEMMHNGREVRLFPSAEPKFLLKNNRKLKRKNKAVINELNPAKIRLSNHFCRLCAEEKKDVISIYGWRGKNTCNLEKKLKYFPFGIDKCDVLPLGVCQECMVKVDQFVEFVETCIEAQTKLKDLLNDRISNLTVQIVDPIKEILANSLVVPNQETQYPSLNKTKTVSGEEERIQNFDKIQSAGSDEEQIQSVDEILSAATVESKIQSDNEVQSAGIDERQIEDVNKLQNTDLEVQIQSFNGTQSTDVGEAQNTSLDETQTINIDLSQLLNVNQTRTTNLDETQNASFVVASQPPPVSSECNLDSYVHFDEILPPDLYQSLMNVPIEEKNRSEQNCPEPVPDVIKFTDEDLLTLYGANDNNPTLHKNSNFNCTYLDVPTYDPFAPQMMHQTAIINTSFDNIEKLTCDFCFKDFETSEMLNSHLKTHYVESNNDNFEECTALDFYSDFNEQISEKAKESDLGINVSNTEPHDPSKVQPEGAGSQLKEKKSNLKRKKRGRGRRKMKPECEFCEKLFETFEECEEHEKTHKGSQRYVCLKCNGTYRSKKILRRHIPVHSGEIFPCPHCQTIFKRKDSLQNHGRLHRRLTCKICRFVFKQKAEFLKHEKDHELPRDLPTELYDAEQSEKEFCEPDLPDLISEGGLLVPDSIDEFLANTDPIQLTCVAVPNEFTPMDDIEQIIANRIIAMEI